MDHYSERDEAEKALVAIRQRRDDAYRAHEQALAARNAINLEIEAIDRRYYEACHRIRREACPSGWDDAREPDPI
jgi:hypothetical protein